ncbi:MAG: hypothetical protein AAF429_09345 [Pseudomonadota bacterium]
MFLSRMNHKTEFGTQSNLYVMAALIGLIAFLCADIAAAHVRWFTDANDPNLVNFPSYALTDTPVLIWTAICLVMISVAIFLDGRLPTIRVVDSKLRHEAIELMRILTGVSFLLTAYGGELLAPHLTAFGAFGMALVFLKALIGILLIASRFIHHAAILMILLWLGTVLQHGFIKGFEYVNIVGIALFLFFNYTSDMDLRAKLKPYSVGVLRIFTGMALVALGFSEKLLGAALGQAFVANFDWNFMQMLGFEWYTDQLFVLSAGMIEVAIGIIFILGVLTRLNTLVIAGMMFLSNIIFVITGENDKALIEMIGHMPTIATAIILLLLGGGQRLRLKKPNQAPVVEIKTA